MKNKIKSKKRLYLFIPLKAVLVLMNVAAFAVAVIGKNVWLFIACFFLLVLTLVGIYMIASLSKSINKFYQTMEKQLSPYTYKSLRDFPLPGLVTRRRGGEIIWYNNQMREKVFGGSDCFGHSLAEYFPAVNLLTECPVQGYGVEYNGHQYTAYHAPTGEEDNRLNVLYLVDDDKLKRIAREFFSSRPVAAIILIDNYEELLQSARENERSQIMGEIEYQIECYVENYNGVIKKLEKDRFFVAFEERYMRSIVEERFTILDTVRKINANGRMPATLSIGVGHGGATMQECQEMARESIDIALGRGGDQAAVKTVDGFEFFGGISHGVEKRSHVRSRIIANALADQIRQSDSVIIMGHRQSDLDAIGSAIGLLRMCKMCDVPSVNAVRSKATLAGQLLDVFNKAGEDHNFIEPEETYKLITPKTLLIVTDTYQKRLLEDQKIYEKCSRVVVIDHHRMAVGHIDNPILLYHEPFATSAIELVCELLQFMPAQNNITQLEAQALLSGIMLDTRSFALHVGVRTFEAAAWLRSRGAETAATKRLFNISKEEYEARAAIVEGAYLYKGCAIATSDELDPAMSVVLPMAANDLLTINGVDASFVAIAKNGGVNISARSMGALNVQVILEPLGGGGHLTMAGAQLRDCTVKEAEARIRAQIDEYRANQECQEELVGAV